MCDMPIDYTRKYTSGTVLVKVIGVDVTPVEGEGGTGRVVKGYLRMRGRSDPAEMKLIDGDEGMTTRNLFVLSFTMQYIESLGEVYVGVVPEDLSRGEYFCVSLALRGTESYSYHCIESVSKNNTILHTKLVAMYLIVTIAASLVEMKRKEENISVP